MWRFIGARSSARCDVCGQDGKYLFRDGELFRCWEHLGRQVMRAAMRRG